MKPSTWTPKSLHKIKKGKVENKIMQWNQINGVAISLKVELPTRCLVYKCWDRRQINNTNQGTEWQINSWAGLQSRTYYEFNREALKLKKQTASPMLCWKGKLAESTEYIQALPILYTWYLYGHKTWGSTPSTGWEEYYNSQHQHTFMLKMEFEKKKTGSLWVVEKGGR